MDPATVLRELEDKIRRGASGVKLLPIDYTAALDDPRHNELYDFCQSAGVPILHGPGRECFYRPTGWKDTWGHPLELAEVLRRFPRLRTCQAHLHHAPFIAELARRHAGVHADLSAILTRVGDAANQIAPAKLVADIRAIGADRVLFGSNFGTIPEQDAIREADTFRNLPLTDDEFRQIGSENHIRLTRK
jgi:predicted TIM-barrel fold metal-dependent hydrolase